MLLAASDMLRINKYLRHLETDGEEVVFLGFGELAPCIQLRPTLLEVLQHKILPFDGPRQRSTNTAEAPIPNMYTVQPNYLVESNL